MLNQRNFIYFLPGPNGLSGSYSSYLQSIPQAHMSEMKVYLATYGIATITTRAQASSASVSIQRLLQTGAAGSGIHLVIAPGMKKVSALLRPSMQRQTPDPFAPASQ